MQAGDNGADQKVGYNKLQLSAAGLVLEVACPIFYQCWQVGHFWGRKCREVAQQEARVTAVTTFQAPYAPCFCLQRKLPSLLEACAKVAVQLRPAGKDQVCSRFVVTPAMLKCLDAQTVQRCRTIATDSSSDRELQCKHWLVCDCTAACGVH